MTAVPVEIIQMICSHLSPVQESELTTDHHIHRITLVNICLASRTFNHVARRFLYHTVEFDNTTTDLTSWLLLGTLARSPDARYLVRRLQTSVNKDLIEQYDPDDVVDTRAFDMPHPDLLPAINKVELPSELQDRLRRSIRERLQDAEHALLLCLCTNLESWSTVVICGMLDSILFDVVRALISSHSTHHSPLNGRPLQHVREVEMSFDDDEYRVEIGSLADIFSIPDLETFRGQELFAALTHQRLPPALKSTVKRVYLEISHVDAPGVEHILIACPQLETLSIEWISPVFTVAEISAVQYDVIGRALNQHGPMLREVNLSTPDSRPSNYNHKRLGSLRNMASLRQLAVPYVALFGNVPMETKPSAGFLSEALPLSLEILTIHDASNYCEPNDEIDLDEQLLVLMHHALFTQLSAITLYCYERFAYPLQLAEWNEIKENDSVVLERGPLKAI